MKSQNTFSDGLASDFNVMSMPNTAMSDCLNGTTITYNGNEFALQTDMGNGRVETAYLPSGYVPVGMKEHGGIIYVASHNPLTGYNQIGSFPSPERNLDTEELSQFNDLFSSGFKQGEVIYKYKVFGDRIIRSGDKFMLALSKPDLETAKQIITDCYEKSTRNKVFNLSLAVADSKNNLIDITKSLKQYKQLGNIVQTVESGGYFILFGDQTYLTSETRDTVDENISKNELPLQTYNNRIFGNLFLIVTVNAVTTYEVAIEGVKINKPNGLFDVELLFIVNYKYNCPDGFSWKDGNRLILPNTKYQSLLGSVVTLDGDKYTLDLHDTQTVNIQGYIYKCDQLPTFIEDTKLASFQQFVKHTLKNKHEGDILSYEFTPFINYGINELNGYKISGQLNLSKLNSNTFTLQYWKYLYADNITIIWTMEAFPLFGKSVDYVKFEFYNMLDSGTNVLTPQYTYTIPKKISFNGTFTEIIDSKLLDSKTMYLVKVVYSVDSKERVLGYRWLLTTELYNKYFYQEDILDYCADYDKMQPTVYDVTVSFDQIKDKSATESQLYLSQKYDMDKGEFIKADVSQIDLSEVTKRQVIHEVNIKPSIDNSINPFIQEIKVNKVSLIEDKIKYSEFEGITNINVNKESTDTSLKYISDIQTSFRAHPSEQTKPIQVNDTILPISQNEHYQEVFNDEYVGCLKLRFKRSGTGTRFLLQFTLLTPKSYPTKVEDNEEEYYYNTNNGYLPESAIDDSVVVLEPSIYNSKHDKLYHAIYEKEYSEDTKDTQFLFNKTMKSDNTREIYVKDYWNLIEQAIIEAENRNNIKIPYLKVHVRSQYTSESAEIKSNWAKRLLKVISLIALPVVAGTVTPLLPGVLSTTVIASALAFYTTKFQFEKDTIVPNALDVVDKKVTQLKATSLELVRTQDDHFIPLYWIPLTSYKKDKDDPIDKTKYRFVPKNHTTLYAKDGIQLTDSSVNVPEAQDYEWMKKHQLATADNILITKGNTRQNCYIPDLTTVVYSPQGELQIKPTIKVDFKASYGTFNQAVLNNLRALNVDQTKVNGIIFKEDYTDKFNLQANVHIDSKQHVLDIYNNDTIECAYINESPENYNIMQFRDNKANNLTTSRAYLLYNGNLHILNNWLVDKIKGAGFMYAPYRHVTTKTSATVLLYKEKPFFTYSLFCGSHKNTDGFMMAHFNDIPSAALDGDIEEIIEEIENNEQSKDESV